MYAVSIRLRAPICNTKFLCVWCTHIVVCYTGKDTTTTNHVVQSYYTHCKRSCVLLKKVHVIIGGYAVYVTVDIKRTAAHIFKLLRTNILLTTYTGQTTRVLHLSYKYYVVHVLYKSKHKEHIYNVYMYAVRFIIALRLCSLYNVIQSYVTRVALV